MIDSLQNVSSLLAIIMLATPDITSSSWASGDPAARFLLQKKRGRQALGSTPKDLTRIRDGEQSLHENADGQARNQTFCLMERFFRSYQTEWTPKHEYISFV
jgi:hypothetical protein